MSSSTPNTLSRVNTTYLSKDATEKDRQLKMQMFKLIDKDDSSSSEQIWVKNGFSRDKRSDLTVRKENFPENTLVYCNQGEGRGGGGGWGEWLQA